MKTLIRLVLTNWVHLIGIYFGFYFGNIILKALGLNDYGWYQILLLSVVTIPFLLFTYGFQILVGFFLIITILDLLLFSFRRVSIRQNLFIEWLIIIPIFIYWAIENQYWYWIMLCVSFFLTQLIREKKIMKLMHEK